MIKFILILLCLTTTVNAKPPLPTKIQERNITTVELNNIPKQYSKIYNKSLAKISINEKLYYLTRNEKNYVKLGIIIFEFEKMKLERKKSGDGLCFQEIYYIPKTELIANEYECMSILINNRIKPVQIKLEKMFPEAKEHHFSALHGRIYMISNLLTNEKANYKRLRNILIKTYKKNKWKNFSKQDRKEIIIAWANSFPDISNKDKFKNGWKNRAKAELIMFFEGIDKYLEFVKKR